MRCVGWRPGCGPPTCPPPTERRLPLRWTHATAGIAPRIRGRRERLDTGREPMRCVGWRPGCGPPTCPPPTENRLPLRWTHATAGIAPRIRGRRAAARPAPDTPPWLSRLLVRHVPRDDLVHRLPRGPDPLFAHGQTMNEVIAGYVSNKKPR